MKSLSQIVLAGVVALQAMVPSLAQAQEKSKIVSVIISGREADSTFLIVEARTYKMVFLKCLKRNSLFAEVSQGRLTSLNPNQCLEVAAFAEEREFSLYANNKTVEVLLYSTAGMVGMVTSGFVLLGFVSSKGHFVEGAERFSKVVASDAVRSKLLRARNMYANRYGVKMGIAGLIVLGSAVVALDNTFALVNSTSEESARTLTDTTKGFMVYRYPDLRGLERDLREAGRLSQQYQ